MILRDDQASKATGRVAVLLATYNGARYLDAQIASLATQTLPNIDVWVSDDGSTDSTIKIVNAWKKRWQKGSFHLLQGPGQGVAANFASLLKHSGIDADHFAYCDQDDLWDADKLERAVAWIGSSAPNPIDGPRVYAGRTRLIGPEGERLGLSPLFSKPPSFRNAISQSIAGGNTMVLNRAARDLLAETTRRTAFVLHDWWTYLVVTGAGGAFHYDPQPAVSYRQHGRNAVGANDGWAARLDRLWGVAEGRHKAWNDTNVAALKACEDLLTPEARQTLDAFVRARSGLLPARLWHLARARVLRQTQFGQAGLILACAMNRL